MDGRRLLSLTKERGNVFTFVGLSVCYVQAKQWSVCDFFYEN